MKMINKLERKFGRYAIKNLSLYLILGYVIGYLLLMFAPQVLSKLILVPAFVMQGEVWRLLTWVITPPELSVSIFTIIMLFFIIVSVIYQNVQSVRFVQPVYIWWYVSHDGRNDDRIYTLSVCISYSDVMGFSYLYRIQLLYLPVFIFGSCSLLSGYAGTVCNDHSG